MDSNFTGVAAIFFIFGAPVICLAWIILRILAHRERIEMIRMGIPPPINQHGARRSAPQSYSPQGQGASMDVFDAENAQLALHKGIRLAFVGLALTIGLSFIGYHPNDGPLGAPVMVPGPWLLGGLIPLFVGIAQIIIGILSGARVSAPQRFGASEGGPQSSPSPPMPGPYTYRPDNTTGLTRPVSPPDVKN